MRITAIFISLRFALCAGLYDSSYAFSRQPSIDQSVHHTEHTTTYHTSKRTVNLSHSTRGLRGVRATTRTSPEFFFSRVHPGFLSHPYTHTNTRARAQADFLPQRDGPNKGAPVPIPSKVSLFIIHRYIAGEQEAPNSTR